MMKGPVKHNKQCYVLLGSACGLLLILNNAQASMSPSEMERITTNWICQWCPYKKEAASKSEVEVGLGSVSNDSFKHGKYTGLDQKGAYLISNGSYEYKNGDSRYINAEVQDIGLDSRQLLIEGGNQGRYDLELSYSMLPSLNIDTARTPYRGDSNQSLPGSWVQSATTTGMTQLTSSLRDVDIYTERQTVDVGASYYVSPSLSMDVGFQQQTRQGNKALGLDFFFASSAILAVPVDTETNQGKVKVNYRSQKWQGSLSYDFSMFNNKHDYIRWESAFTGTPATGQAAVDPDNFRQQMTLDGVYRFSKDTQATVTAAFGRMSQDDDFLPYTATSSLATLPRTSLDGKVDTFNTILRFNSRLNQDWDYTVQYLHNEQENKTDRATYSYLRTDDAANPGTPRANFPYSFRERELSVEGRYQINVRKFLNLGYERNINDRTYQEVETTNEDTLSAFYRSKVNESLQWYLKIDNTSRVGDKYVPVTEISPAEDPLLRKYNLADRKRRMISASLSYLLTDDLQIGVFGDHANDDYSDSDVGMQESKQSTVSLEMQYRVNKDLGVSFDYSAIDIDSTQAGTSWEANNGDSIYIAHIGVNYQLAKYKLSLGADYTHANAVGDIVVSTGDAFPKLESTRNTFSLFADYNLTKQSAIHAYFSYEDYEENDWAIDGVVPNTLNSVLTLGEASPSYDIGVLAISYRAHF